MSSFLWSFEVLTQQTRLCCLTDLPLQPHFWTVSSFLSSALSTQPFWAPVPHTGPLLTICDLRMPPLLPGMCHCISTAALCVHHTCQVTWLHLKSLCSFGLPVVLTQLPHQLGLLAPEFLQPKAAASGQGLRHENISSCFLTGSCTWTISPHEMMRGTRCQAQREGSCDHDFNPKNAKLNGHVTIEGGDISQESRSSGTQAGLRRG